MQPSSLLIVPGEGSSWNPAILWSRDCMLAAVHSQSRIAGARMACWFAHRLARTTGRRRVVGGFACTLVKVQARVFRPHQTAGQRSRAAWPARLSSRIRPADDVTTSWRGASPEERR